MHITFFAKSELNKLLDFVVYKRDNLSHAYCNDIN